MTASARQKMISDIQLRLGGGIVDNELDPQHYEYGITAALDRYRQRSGNSMEESFIFLDVQPDVQDYKLPDEVQEVRSIYRRNIGGSAGSSIDPFSLAFTNNIYMIQNPGGMGGSGAGTLATYDFAMQFQSLAGRMFGRDLLFTWNTTTKNLKIERRFGAIEQVALHCYNAKPDEVLLIDVYAKPWLRDYATAMCKLMMGEARSKFGNLGGPQGGVTLNGEALKNEAKEEMERLEQEIINNIDQNGGMPFIIG